MTVTIYAPAETGVPGPPGPGVPTGGTTGQVLAKATDTNFDDEWVNPANADDLSVLTSRVAALEALNIVTYDGDGAVGAADGDTPADTTLATHLFVDQAVAVGVTAIANAAAISFEPAGSVAATDVQAAIEEVAP